MLTTTRGGSAAIAAVLNAERRKSPTPRVDGCHSTAPGQTTSRRRIAYDRVILYNITSRPESWTALSAMMTGDVVPSTRSRSSTMLCLADGAGGAAMRRAQRSTDAAAASRPRDHRREPRRHRRLRDHQSAQQRQGHAAAPISVYRALEFLLRHGLVHRVESLNAYFACSIRRRAVMPRQFLICRRCRTVAEIKSPEIEEAIAAGAQSVGFAVTSPVVEIGGLCLTCSRADR